MHEKMKNVLLDAAVSMAREAGKIALESQQRLTDIRLKGEKDIVTEVDLACDKLIRERILEAFPGHNLITEENIPLDQGSPFTWFVDPIDGTINYSRGMPLWGVSIGVAAEGEMLAGAIYLPSFEEMFTTVLGGGAYLNGKKLAVSDLASLERGIVSHGDINIGVDDEERIRLNEENFTTQTRLADSMQRVKCLGSAVVEAAYVAAGRLDAYCMVYFKPWDVAAASLLVREAGGRITQLDGQPWSLNSPHALFSNGILHTGILETLNRGEK